MPTQTPPQDQLMNLLFGVNKPNTDSNYLTKRNYLDSVGLPTVPAHGEIQAYTPQQQYAMNLLYWPAQAEKTLRDVRKNISKMEPEDILNKFADFAVAITNIGKLAVQGAKETGKITTDALKDANDFYTGKGTSRIKGEYVPERVIPK